jgi:hypothetical protein
MWKALKIVGTVAEAVLTVLGFISKTKDSKKDKCNCESSGT